MSTHLFSLWVRKILWKTKWQPTPVLLPEKFHGLRSLVGYSPWGHKESDTTEQLYLLYFNGSVGKALVPVPQGASSFALSPALLCTSFCLLGPYLCIFFPKTKSLYEVSFCLECPTLPLPYPLAISSKKFYLTPLPNLSSAVKPYLTS